MAIANRNEREDITGVRVVQSMNRQDSNLRKFDVLNQDTVKSNLYAARLSSLLIPPVDILTALAIGLSLLFGSRMVSAGELEIGALVAFVLYIQRFFDPIRNLTMQYTQLQRAMASGARIFETLDMEPGLVDSPDATELSRLKGEIEVRGVSYGYAPGQDVLYEIDLHVAPGQTVAVVGPTGAGKTTLVSLIARFYDVERGRGAILVDGHDVRAITRASLRSRRANSSSPNGRRSACCRTSRPRAGCSRLWQRRKRSLFGRATVDEVQLDGHAGFERVH